MIEQTEKGWRVIGRNGKVLSKDDLTEEEARKRLREIHAFKYMRAHQVGPKIAPKRSATPTTKPRVTK